MPTRSLSDAEMARLTGWPAGIDATDLVAFFTPGPDDVHWLHRHRRDAANRLGLAVQLCTLPWLGWVPDELTGCPTAAVGRLAGLLGVDPARVGELLAGYGGFHEETRRAHLRKVLNRLGWRTAGVTEWKQLDELLLARAMEHDSPTVLLEQACDWLRREHVARPGVDRLSRRVAAAREAAAAETYQRLLPLLDERRAGQLDGLLAVDAEVGTTRLAWLRQGATAGTPEVIRVELA